MLKMRKDLQSLKVRGMKPSFAPQLTSGAQAAGSYTPPLSGST
jgi:hypothetical protein